MGLKFERTDNLDKMFENFAVDPEKKVQTNDQIDRFLKPKKEDTTKNSKKK